MISTNEIKYYSSLKQKKYRTNEKKFLIEGYHLVEECLNSSYNLDAIVLNDKTNSDKNHNVIDKARRLKVKVETISEKQFDKLKETENSQGIIGVVNIPKTKSATPGNDIIALDRINDPGNLGTIIRTAYWFGVDSVILSEGSADIYNSKVLRSSQGAVFHVNITCGSNLKERLRLLHSGGYKIYLLTQSAKNEIGKFKFEGKSVFVFGNEAEGISPEILSDDYGQLKIGGFSGCESLNVAVSAGILMFHLKNGVKIV